MCTPPHSGRPCKCQLLFVGAHSRRLVDSRQFFSLPLPFSNSLDCDNYLLSTDVLISISVNSTSSSPARVTSPVLFAQHPCPRLRRITSQAFTARAEADLPITKSNRPTPPQPPLLTQLQQRYCTHESLDHPACALQLPRHLDSLEQFQSRPPRVIAPRLPSSDQAMARSIREPR